MPQLNLIASFRQKRCQPGKRSQAGRPFLAIPPYPTASGSPVSGDPSVPDRAVLGRAHQSTGRRSYKRTTD